MDAPLVEQAYCPAAPPKTIAHASWHVYVGGFDAHAGAPICPIVYEPTRTLLQSLSLFGLHPAGQHPSPPMHCEIIEPPVHAPAEQVVFCVQALPSSHAAPSLPATFVHCF